MPPIKRPGKPFRPSSAAGRLESRPPIPSYENGRPATAAPGLYGQGRGAGRGAAGAGRGSATNTAPNKNTNWMLNRMADLDINVKAIEQPARRMTLGAVDGLTDKDKEQAARVRHYATSAPPGTSLKIEEKINLDDLHSLKKFFEEADVDQNGTLSLDEFKTVLRGSLSLRTKNDEEITNLFMKIDFNSEGTIDWDEFCTYMQLEYEEKEEAYLRKKEVDLHTPAIILNSPHREPVLRITNMSDGTCVTTSQDGTIAFWSGNMELKRSKSVMIEQNMTRQKPKWVTDFVMMTQFNKIIIGTGDREIQFYELSTFEPYCQVTGLETTPLKLTYCATGFDECYLIYGDSEGCINIIIINGVGETLRTWKKLPKTEGIASVTLEKVAHSPLTQFVRWKVHDDWVGDIKYYDDIRSIISCSNSENTALVIGCTVGSTHVESKMKDGKDHGQRPTTADRRAKLNQMHYSHARKRLDNDETVFKIHKGVKTFDFCKEKNLIATGGMDRILRLWNPYVPSKPTGMLRGHNAPIFSLFIAPTENRIYSISQDKTVKVWDTKDQVCMLTIRPKTHKIRGDLQAAHYNTYSRVFVVATDQMAVLTHRVKSQELREIPTTHRTPILCARYNNEFKNVVTTSDASVVKLWDFETGHLVFEFSQAHNNNAITAMSFDNTGRRLITGGRDGRLKVWNYNNGHCLKVLEKAEGNDEVTDVVYIEMNKNRYVISVGWDRCINVYTDSSEDFRHVQRPMPRWTDDEKNGHQEDILSVSACPPSLLATSSYDGEIIVWNLVSGYAYSHIQSTKYFNDDEKHEGYGDESISKVLFIPSRRTNKEAAQLIASGPRGCIHFWNVYNNGQLFGRFNCVKKKGSSVNCMQLSNDDLTLFTGDSLGFVSVWDIDHYCLDRPDNIAEPPELMGSWRGHIQSITSMSLVEEHSILITSSLDCTVRLWTTEGHYVGTFGQDEPWDVFNPSTFKHPMVPYDVLVDPQSMPNHPIFDQKSTSSISEYIEESLEDGQAGGDADMDDGSSQGDENGEKEDEIRDDEKKSDSNGYIGNQEKFVYDDEMIAAELKKKPFNRGSGKRLRHEKLKSMPKERAVTSAYQTLKCFELEDTPPLSPPSRSKDKSHDPFTFS